MKRWSWFQAWGVGLCILMFSPLLKAADDKLKWTFQNMEVKALLHALAEMGQHNLIVADGVSGPVSLHIEYLKAQKITNAAEIRLAHEAGARDLAKLKEWWAA